MNFNEDKVVSDYKKNGITKYIRDFFKNADVGSICYFLNSVDLSPGVYKTIADECSLDMIAEISNREYNHYQFDFLFNVARYGDCANNLTGIVIKARGFSKDEIRKYCECFSVDNIPNSEDLSEDELKNRKVNSAAIKQGLLNCDLACLSVSDCDFYLNIPGIDFKFIESIFKRSVKSRAVSYDDLNNWIESYKDKIVDLKYFQDILYSKIKNFIDKTPKPTNGTESSHYFELIKIYSSSYCPNDLKQEIKDKIIASNVPYYMSSFAVLLKGNEFENLQREVIDLAKRGKSFFATCQGADSLKVLLQHPDADVDTIVELLKSKFEIARKNTEDYKRQRIDDIKTKVTYSNGYLRKLYKQELEELQSSLNSFIIEDYWIFNNLNEKHQSKIFHRVLEYGCVRDIHNFYKNYLPERMQELYDIIKSKGCSSAMLDNIKNQRRAVYDQDLIAEMKRNGYIFIPDLNGDD